ncbi:MAG: hypothetical protein ACRCW2_02025 [Cellulosilyticaceae bacterium]
MKKQLYVGGLFLRKLLKGHPHYKCRMGRIKTNLRLTDDFLLIKQEQVMKKLPFKKVSETSIHEKMWEIRVQVQCGHKMYQFDFPSIKKATDFYEQIVFNKIKAHG